MNKYLSLFISTYQNKYRIQYVLIRLLEKWREDLDNNFVKGKGFHGLT